MAARDHFRAYARRRVDLGATLRDRQTADEQPVRVRDLGIGGARVELADARATAQRGAPRDADGWASSPPRPAAALEPDAAVTLEVTAPTLWDPLPLRGTIVWVRRAAAGTPARAGVRFEHHDAAALYALHQLLGAHAFEL